MSRVAVVGGAGYVGGFLCRALADAGMTPVAVVRPGSTFHLDRLGIEAVSREAAASGPAFDAVINLAYPAAGSVYGFSTQNEALLATIRELGSAGRRVIQVSSQAVFGMALEVSQAPERPPVRRESLYVESKLELEAMLLDELKDYTLDIVRLGNVWGPGSATWTGTIAQRLLFGEAVAVKGHDGYSNLTDVVNLSSYLTHLAGDRGCDGDVRFHHLAEFADVRWSHWINRVASHLDVEPVLTTRPPYPGKPLSEVGGLVKSHARALASDLKESRYAGSLLRSSVRSMPDRASRGVRRKWASGRASINEGQGEDAFLTVIGCETRFEPVIDPAWAPPVDTEASWRAVASWLNDVGYT
ncbi:MAG: NAD-dependent epimerase/dehydratase family protein [Solirubrobacteraceae bacterium]